jgi:Fe2+ or Zn2+ uptake regulation protein
MESSLPTSALVIDALRAKGYRITAIRRAMIESLLHASRPLSALEIAASLKRAKLTPNKSSIYRELEFLLNNKLISEIDVLEGMKRYEWFRADAHHHHHIVCTKCHTVECIDLCFNEAEIAKKVERKSGFEVTSHLLEFFGICKECRR